MADIVNVQAVAFCNQKVRKMADLLSAAYYSAITINDEWNATGMSGLIPNTADPVIDGSATDGRSPITGAKATSIIVRAQELIADMEANSNAKLNTVLQVRVNGGAHF